LLFDAVENVTEKVNIMSEDFIEAIKEEMSHIRPFEEGDDNWAFEGQGFLRKRQYALAEKKFKELVASQPKHQDGFEGLAYVYYYMGEKEKALWFMRKAINLAREFLENDSIDIEVIDEMEGNLSRMENDKELNEWWAKD